MIEAVLFDLHGVITSSPWATLAAVGTGSGHDEQAVLDVMLGDYTTDGDHPWHRLERGEIGIADYAAAAATLAAEAGIALDWNRLRGFSDRMTVNDAVIDRIRTLRAEGRKTAIVTNNVKEMSSGWRALLPADELFDAVVDSSEVGVRKPNPAIFEIALERLGGIAPEHAVFLDDAPGNIVGAQLAGLHTILVDDLNPSRALAALDELLAR